MNRRKKKKIGLPIRTLIAMFAVTLLLGGAIGGTMAWLSAGTTPVENTFTKSDIGVDLKETENDFKMVPGATIDKDPKAWVTETSEDCYLFVKITESNNLDAYIKYAVDETEWTKLEDGVYYKILTTANAKKEHYSILGAGKYTYDFNDDDPDNDIEYEWTADEVLVLPTVTKAMMDDAKVNAPKLTFKAYAVQYWQKDETPFEAATAWAIASKEDTSSGNTASDNGEAGTETEDGSETEVTP